MTTIMEHEMRECERANATGRQPVVSSTVSGCSPAVGTGGHQCSNKLALLR
jgi:hypothetical protein